jgi:hypothetical protein
MKKNKFSVLGMLAIVLALCLAFVGCATDSGGEPYDGPKSIKITGFNLDVPEGLEFVITETLDGPKIARRWNGGSSSGTRTVSSGDLFDIALGNDQLWTGTGNYFISLNPADGLPESVDYYYSVDGINPSKYYIKDAVTVLDFAKFVLRP